MEPKDTEGQLNALPLAYPRGPTHIGVISTSARGHKASTDGCSDVILLSVLSWPLPAGALPGYVRILNLSLGGAAS